MNSSPPSADEIELSVFGRGFGEGICVHFGNNDWMIVDSCIDPNNDRPAALTYLESIGVDPADHVDIIVATHWHDDHIRGISDILSASTRAAIVCPAALAQKDIVSFVEYQAEALGRSGSGVDEFRNVLHISAGRRRPIIWAKASLPLHPRIPGSVPDIVALSPSDEAFQLALTALIEAATKAKVSIPRRFRAPPGANGTSIAVAVLDAEAGILLGADVENTSNPNTGWDAIVSSPPPKRGSAVKVPHHGSLGAHHDKMWSDLLFRDSLAIVTPWIVGNRHLPTDDDISRIKSFSGTVFVTSLPSDSISRVKPDKMVRRLHDAPISRLGGWGHVRARRGRTERAWRVELAGDAKQV